MFNNPYFFDQAKKNMTAENLKTASERMSNMSDEELKNMTKMSGFNISPEMLKMSANMMKNMSPEELERMKNMSSNMNFNPYSNNSSNFQHSPSYSEPKNTKSENLKKSNTDSFETNEKIVPFPKIENLKKKGNDFFNQNQYDEASTSYLEAILEIEEVKMQDGKYDKEEIKRLEIACRMNYATAKAKLNEYEIVLTQAQEVLKYGENGKAFFRLGQALHHLGRNEKALPNLEQASKLLPNDSIVASYLEKVKSFLNQKEKQNPAPSQNTDNKENFEKKNNVSSEKPKNSSEKISEEKKGLIEQDSEPKKEKIEMTNKSVNKNDVLIEEEKKQVEIENNAPKKPNLPTPPLADLNQAKKSVEQIKNMSPEQMQMMSEYFKNMDNSFLKEMMKQQTGVEMSESDLQSVKSMMNPDMLKMMSGMDLDNLPMQNPRGDGANNPSSVPMNLQQTPPSMGSMTQNIGNLMQNKDLINNMMENMKKNPEMLKSMGKMFGQDSKIGDLIEKSSPEDLQKMMNMMQGVLGVFGKISSLFGWMKKNAKFMIFLAIMAFIYFFWL